jgi:hypothetical protein
LPGSTDNNLAEDEEKEWRDDVKPGGLAAKETNSKEYEDDQFVKDVLKLAQQTKGIYFEETFFDGRPF